MVKTRAHDEMGCQYIIIVGRRFPAIWPMMRRAVGI